VPEMTTTAPSSASPELIDDLITANRILAQQQILDGFGHMTVRDDSNPQQYLMSRALPGKLVTPGDVVAFTLDSVPVNAPQQHYHGERYIHGEIYKRRPDVNAVAHCHAPALLPFGITGAKLRPIYHMSSFLADGPPVYDIAEKGGTTNMQVNSPVLGGALAEVLGNGPMVLMRGHGATIVGPSLKHVVFRAVYAVINATMQLEAMKLGAVAYLTPGEVDKTNAFLQMGRAWACWKSELPT
jgi:ribulose-5-phosphate 4-epimerase/fuculose-1-phosphate aldolase